MHPYTIGYLTILQTLEEKSRVLLNRPCQMFSMREFTRSSAMYECIHYSLSLLSKDALVLKVFSHILLFINERLKGTYHSFGVLRPRNLEKKMPPINFTEEKQARIKQRDQFTLRHSSPWHWLSKSKVFWALVRVST